MVPNERLKAGAVVVAVDAAAGLAGAELGNAEKPDEEAAEAADEALEKPPKDGVVEAGKLANEGVVGAADDGAEEPNRF